MRFLTIFFLTLFLNGGLFDFYTHKQINRAYKEKRYKDAIEYLKKLPASAVRNFDLGVSYYKNKEYKKALRYFKRAYGKGVDEFERLYNIGNSYFKLKEYKKAIKAYEMALGIKRDKDAIFNLYLAKEALKKRNNPSKKKKEKNAKSKKKNQKKRGKKDRKLTKKELEELKRRLEKERLSKDIKKMLKRSFEKKEVPVLMYKVRDGKSNLQKPW